MSDVTSGCNEISISESITSSDCVEDTQLDYGGMDAEPSCESLLSLLDDKNRTIANLQNQIQNQKIQLQYYMSNRLSSTKINELAESCTIVPTDENMSLNLAMNKFYNQMGMKTKLCGLYDRMRLIDKRIVSSLQDQEFIVRKIVNRLCDFLKQQSSHAGVEFKSHFGGFIVDPIQIQLFDGLVDATVNLRKSLDCYKICCDRLLTVEEERNAIVDQVYSMPADQRINCNYLLGIQMEKMQLENEIKRLLNQQAAGSKRIKELNTIESILANLQHQLRCSYAEKDDNQISHMLRKVDSEAKLLLAMAQEQRRRYEAEMSRRGTDPLSRALGCVRLAVDCLSPTKTELIANGIASPEEIRAWELIKHQIDRLRSRMHAEFSEKLNTKCSEVDTVKNKWRDLVLENNELKISVQALKEELRETNFNNESHLKRLIRERDAYKSQVEDLETIREAYAQLVDRRPNSNKVEREYLKQLDEKDKRICGIEEENIALRKEVNHLKKTTKEQTDQIGILNRLLNLSETPHLSAHEQEEESTNNNLKTSILGPEASNKGGIEPILEATEPSNVAVEQEIISVKTQSETSWGDTDNRIQPNLLAPCRLQSFPNEELSKIAKINKQEIVNFKEARSSPDNECLTCLEIYSTNRKGRTTDLVKAVIKTNSCMEGNLKREDPSCFSLEFSCKNGEDLMVKSTNFATINEYELHKDCSNETIPQKCYPKKKKYLKALR